MIRETHKYTEVELPKTRHSSKRSSTKALLESKPPSKDVKDYDNTNIDHGLARMHLVHDTKDAMTQPPSVADNISKDIGTIQTEGDEVDYAVSTITVSVAVWQQQQARITELESQLAEAKQEISKLEERRDHWKARNEKHKADYRAMKERCKEAEDTLEALANAVEEKPSAELDLDTDKAQTASNIANANANNPRGTSLALPADFEQKRSEFYDEYRPKVVQVGTGKSANGLHTGVQRLDLTVSALGLPRGQVFPSPLKGAARPEYPSSPSKSKSLSASPEKRSASPTKAVWR
ncbi:hypothetical protein FRC18_010538 [Serendipita sp. 400]|nr:hypothetical protein FRC18_010538 [Serendipita sp. 400]